MVSVQDLSNALAAAKEQLQQARRGFEALVAYFGENPVALQNDGDFWRDVMTFVAAFSAAQQDALAFKQVPAVDALCQPLPRSHSLGHPSCMALRAGAGGIQPPQPLLLGACAVTHAQLRECCIPRDGMLSAQP